MAVRYMKGCGQTSCGPLAHNAAHTVCGAEVANLLRFTSRRRGGLRLSNPASGLPP